MEPQTARKSSFLKNPITYVVFLVVIIALIGTYLLFQVIGGQTSTQGADYVENQPKDQATVGVLIEVTGLYPNIPFDVDSISINNSIFEGLAVLRNGRVQPAVAESWTNPDNVTWRVKLRENIKFHNGEELEASDVKYSIEEAKKNQDWVSNQLAARISSVEIIDESTVELKTANPEPTLMHWLVFVFILSEDQVGQDGLENAVGTGPYKVKTITAEEAVLEANTEYWSGAPKVRNLTYKAFEDRDKMAEGLKAGEADLAVFPVSTYNKELEAADFRILPGNLGDVNLLGFDTSEGKSPQVDTDQNPFSNVDVRNAILLALDVSKLLEAQEVQGKALTQIGVEELIGYNTELTRPSTNVDSAKELMEKAGFENGFAVTLDLGETTLNLGEEIKRQLAEIGVKVTLNTYTDFNEYFERLYGDSSFFLVSYVPDTLDSIDLLNSFVHTPNPETGKGAFNFQGYSSSDIDTTLDEALSTFDTKERAALTQTTHKEVMEKVPYAPLYTSVTNFVVAPDVTFKPAPFGYVFGFEISGREKVNTTNQ